MKKKIMFMVHTLQIGGAEKVLVNLLKYIDKSKYDITVIAIVNDGVLVDEIKKIKGIRYYYLFNAFFKKSRYNKNSPFYSISSKIMSSIWNIYFYLCKHYSKQLYKHFIKETFDLEIAFLEGKCAKLIYYSTNKNSKKMAWIHTDISKSKSFQNSFLNNDEKLEVYRNFNKIICVSEEVKQQFISEIQDFGNISVKLNPIDSNKILNLSKESIDLKTKSNIPVLCSIGRLVYQKGFDRLLKVHKRLIENNIPNYLWIIGDGIDRNTLEDYIFDNNLQNSVTLLGYQDNPYKYLSKADIFVCSSRTEGLSSALIEATILNKPIVSTKVAGIHDIFGKDTDNALIVDNNTDSLYTGLFDILTNKSLFLHYADNIKKMENNFSIEKTISSIEKSFDELLYH